MTTAVLPDQVIMNGKKIADLRSFSTDDLNTQMDNHALNTIGRTTFYAQWALANSGYYTGPITGTYPAGAQTSTDMFNAFHALWAAQYDDPAHTYPEPANGHVSFKFFKAVIEEESSVDTSVYKVTS